MDAEVQNFYSPFCNLCSLSFSKKGNLNSHIRRKHPEILLPIQSKNEESLEYFTFYSENEFKDWKDDLEKQTYSSYVLSTGSKRKANGSEIRYYQCYRSGRYEEKKDRKRAPKIKGSVKLGTTCPSRITVVKTTVEEAVEIEVTFAPTHVGHFNDPSLLRTANTGKRISNEKQKIRLAMIREGKEPPVKDKPTVTSGTKKCSVLKKPDLKKAEKKNRPTRKRPSKKKKRFTYNIDDAIKLHINDATSVEYTVKELQDGSANPVILYKPFGKKDETWPDLKESDFILAIMNYAQLFLLTVYGSNIIQIDCKEGTNTYNFQLTTVLIKNLNHEGFPVAVMFSNKLSIEIIKSFFSAIKERLQTFKYTLCPLIFLSNDEPVYYEAWTHVFGTTDLHILSTWHLDQAFQSHLTKKIQNEELRSDVAQELRALHTELDICTFYQQLKVFSAKWNACTDTNEFVQHFTENYANRVEQWAFCYTQGNGNDMMLENWHKEIEPGETKSKTNKRLDKAINSVMKAVKCRLTSPVIHNFQHKLASKIFGLKKCHEKGLELSNDGIVELEDGVLWSVPTTQETSSSLKSYKVHFLSDSCEFNCGIVCQACQMCIHQYTCTCPESRVAFTMCKHIHKICSAFHNKHRTEHDTIEQVTVNTNWNVTEYDTLEQAIVNTINNSTECTNLQEELVTTDNNRTECATVEQDSDSVSLGEQDFMEIVITTSGSQETEQDEAVAILNELANGSEIRAFEATRNECITVIERSVLEMKDCASREHFDLILQSLLSHLGNFTTGLVVSEQS